ncbi:MAG TPA: ATP-binding protein [Kofleriaceae bacterium]|nr:ATP-binding protein [Kofleriaceae bacterium]
MSSETEAVLLRLLHHTQQLMGLVGFDEILARSGHAARELTGARDALACYAVPGLPWGREGRGIRVGPSGQTLELSDAARSAMFAIHRRLAEQRGPLTLEPGAATAAIFAGLSLGEDTAIYALPILHRTGRLWGELALVFEARPPRPPGDATLAALHELARSTTAALENAQRLAIARRDQDRLLLLAQAAEEALWDWNLDTREFWWSGSIHGLLGSGGDIVQNNARWKLERIHPEDAARIEASLEVARAGVASSWKEHYRFRRADGSWLRVEDYGYFLREVSGRAYRIIGAMRDVTAVYDAIAREQRARAEAERANRAKDDFLAMLGHELRNPLAPIVTAAQLLRRRGPEAGERELGIIERQAHQLIHLVDDLLDVSRIAHAKIELRPERLEVGVAVTDAIDMARPLIEQREHALTVDVPRAGLEVDADRARLAQVIANLLTNAAKYTEPRGRITVTAHRDGDRDAGDVVIAVRDTGIGISAEILPTVFEMFVQERQAIDRAQGGLGLGLSIVRGLVELHGGTVSARSEGLGRGSELAIRLPAIARAKAAAAAEPETTALAAARGHRILVVDDNEDAAAMLADLLECLGNTTRIAHHPYDALRLTSEFQPELALLDIGLPEMDGYELARRLRELPPARSIRLIALTGYGQDSDRAQAQAAGFDAHFVKPVAIEALDGLIKRLFGGGPAPRT